jgi:hypothetical protein
MVEIYVWPDDGSLKEPKHVAIQWRTEGAFGGFKPPTKIPIKQSQPEFPVPWKIHP